FICRYLTAQLQSAPDIQVIGTARGGRRAVELVRELRPHVVTLDVDLPDMSGLDALEHIMHDCPTPVVLISGVSRRAAAVTVEDLERGAVDFVLKYRPGVDTNSEMLRREIVSRVRVAAGVKVIRSLSCGPRPERIGNGDGGIGSKERPLA